MYTDLEGGCVFGVIGFENVSATSISPGPMGRVWSPLVQQEPVREEHPPVYQGAILSCVMTCIFHLERLSRPFMYTEKGGFRTV